MAVRTGLRKYGLAWGLCNLGWGLLLWAGLEAESTIDYFRDIRPILANNCYTCHGPDEKTRMAGLRLDRRDSALSPLVSGGFAILPGDVSESKLLERVSAEDSRKRMPPAATGKRLTQDQIDLLREWIRQGADWQQQHWAYTRPEQPARPEVQNRQWPQNEIDYFILARLEKEKLQPSLEASRNTLIRRLSFDLTGLPPTPGEVDAFLADSSPGAYEKLVDRLFASPRYGERMAQHWLDLARYADSDGYFKDLNRSMWPYRDWVIQAFNKNKPFDEFTIEQLAGDLFPNAALEQKIATAFNRNGMATGEGGVDPEEYITTYVVDRVNTTSLVWLGSTLDCAQCHDHKYDPFTQREYYQLYDFFNRLPEKGRVKGLAPPFIKLPSPQQRARMSQLAAEIQALEARIEARVAATMPHWDAAQAEWERQMAQREEKRPRFGEWFSLGWFPADTGGEAFAREFGPEKGVDLNAAYPGNLGWIHRSSWKDGVIQALVIQEPAVIYLYRTVETETAQKLTFFLGNEVGLDDGYQVWLNGRLILAEESAVCVPSAPVQVEVELQPGKNELLFKLVNHLRSHHFYFSTDGPHGEPAHQTIKKILRLPSKERTSGQQENLRRYFRENNIDEVRDLKRELAQLRKSKQQLEAQIPPLRIMEDMADARPTYVLIRGNYRDRGEKVSAGVPNVLPLLVARGEKPDRLDLARWLVDPDHPLVSRVTVNRFWGLLFGTGLVKSAADFGAQGELPSHPELLDWLAREFVESGWDMKALLRKIVMSTTYRQSSKVSQEELARDPYNRLLARSPRFRLPAEMIRDNALAISGLLDRSRPPGGPSVRPYQPEGLWEEKAFECSDRYVPSKGADLYRRSLYTFWKRSVPYPAFVAFDAPSREVCTVQRDRTTTPVQAFVTLNEKTFMEAARIFAERILRESGSQTSERIDYAFKVALARGPSAEEKNVLAALYEKVRAHYQNDPELVLDLMSLGESKPPEQLNGTEVAAWTAVSNAILNLDETITKE